MTDQLWTRLREWLTAGDASGSVIVWSWEQQRLAAPWVVVLIVSGLAGLAIALYATESSSSRRFGRGLLAALRIAAYGLLLLMLAQWTLARQRTGLPTLVIIVDDSASMGIVDREPDAAKAESLRRKILAAGLTEPTRWAQAQALLLEQQGSRWRELAQRYKLELYLLSETLRPVTIAAKNVAGAPQPMNPAAPTNSASSDAIKAPAIPALNAKMPPLPEPLTALRQAEPTGIATRLGSGVLELLNERRGNPPAAVILLSDGVTTAGPDLTEGALLARRMGVPLELVGIGNDSPQADLELGELLAEEFAFVDDLLTIETTVIAVGLKVPHVEIVLRAANQSEPLARQTVALNSSGEPQPIRLAWRPPLVGDYELTVELPLLPEETNAENNRRKLRVSVRDDKIRVLLAAAEPSYDYRYLKELLNREKSLEAKVLLQSADAEFVETNKRGEPISLAHFPNTAEELRQFDCVLLVDIDPTLLTPGAMQLLNDYVKSGGGNAIFLSGQRSVPQKLAGTPLDELLPIDPGEAVWSEPAASAMAMVAVQPSELGFAKPFFQLGNTTQETTEIWANKLDRLSVYVRCARLRAAAQVLAEVRAADDPDGRAWPLIVYRITGAGKVLFHATDETWRWRARYGERYYGRYWLQAIRYLCRAKLLARDKPARLTSDRAQYGSGEPIRLEARFWDEARLAPGARVTVLLEQSDGATRRVELAPRTNQPGDYEATLTRLPFGEYRARLIEPDVGADAQTSWRVLPPAGEREQTQLNWAGLQRAASESKGHAYRIDQTDKLWRGLPPGRRVPVETLPPVPLWNRWPALALVLALFCGEWWLRKRWGMV